MSKGIRAFRPAEGRFERNGSSMPPFVPALPSSPVDELLRDPSQESVLIPHKNRWTSHLLPEFENLITPVRGTLAAITPSKAYLAKPFTTTCGQRWDGIINVRGFSTRVVPSIKLT